MIEAELTQGSFFGTLSATHLVLTPFLLDDGSVTLMYELGRQDGDEASTSSSSTASAHQLLAECLPANTDFKAPTRVLARLQVAFSQDDPKQLFEELKHNLSQWTVGEPNDPVVDEAAVQRSKEVLTAALGLDDSFVGCKLAGNLGTDGHSAIAYDGSVTLLKADDGRVQASLRDGCLLE